MRGGRSGTSHFVLILWTHAHRLPGCKCTQYKDMLKQKGGYDNVDDLATYLEVCEARFGPSFAMVMPFPSPVTPVRPVGDPQGVRAARGAQRAPAQGRKDVPEYEPQKI